jgi:hypothetical protein
VAQLRDALWHGRGVEHRPNRERPGGSRELHAVVEGGQYSPWNARHGSRRERPWGAPSRPYRLAIQQQLGHLHSGDAVDQRVVGCADQRKPPLAKAID